MPPVVFEPAIPASEHPQTHALDGAATGIGSYVSDSMFSYYGGYKNVIHKLMNTRVIGNKESGKIFGPRKNEMSGHLTD